MYELDYPVIGEPSKFAYANAVLAIMENRLLSQVQLDQFRVADSPREFNRMLSETSYGQYLETGLDINQIVEAEIKSTREELYEILPEKIHVFFDVFYRKYDYNNLKMLLKSFFLEREPDPAELSPVGTIPPAELTELFAGAKFEEMNLEFNFEQIDDRMKKTRELRLIDAMIDREYYRELLATARKLGDKFFLDLTRQQIDLKNIIILIRCKKTDLPLETFLLEGGYIDGDVFQTLFGENLDTLVSSPDLYLYRKVISEGLSTMEKTGSYSELETSIRNYFISLLTEVKNVFFSIKPFIGYLLAKEHELNLLKKFYIHINNSLEFSSERDLSYV